MPLIQLDAITKHYTVGTTLQPVLPPLSLTVNHGEYVTIIGASGSGKSTLMHILGFLDQADSGTYRFNDVIIPWANSDQLANIRNRSIGFVFQAFHLLPRLSVLDNVALPLRYQGIHHSLAKERATFALEQTLMTAFVGRYPQQLSGGQQQRVAIARALVTEPALILADEPTGALDSQTSDEILLVFDALHQVGKTLMVVTHNPHVALRSRRIIQLTAGCIVDDRLNT